MWDRILKRLENELKIKTNAIQSKIDFLKTADITPEEQEEDMKYVEAGALDIKLLEEEIEWIKNRR